VNLRPYQERFFESVRSHFDAGVNRQLGVLATGLGKAVLFAALRERMGFQRKIMVLVHREELANQAADKLQRWNTHLRVGVEMAGRYADVDGMFPDTLIVASVPTLGRRGSYRIKKFLPEDFDAVISDEAHHSTSPQWKNVLAHFDLLKPNQTHILSLGLTATPNRSDGQGLRDVFDVISFDMGIRSGIESGFLVDLRGVRVNTKTNLDTVHSRAGDFAEDELSDAVNNDARNAVIVKEWMKHAYGQKTVVFTVDIQHAVDLAAVFKKCSIEAEAVWGDDAERSDKLRRHRDGLITVLCNCAVLTEGYDDPGIKCIVLAKPTKSALLYTQMIGRGTRIDDNKDSCLIMDVVDCTSKHSLMTMPSLLGMPTNLDLRGKSVIKAKEQFERIAREFPSADLSEVLSLHKLDSITENISLFSVHYPPEVSKLSELKWKKSGDDGYMLAVDRASLVTVQKNLIGEWDIRGWVGERKVEMGAQNLSGALNMADSFILSSGGVKPYLAREAGWHGGTPSPAQLALCKKLKIEVPAGATKGQVSLAIDSKLNANRTVTA
jgi:ATP-dependent helicase IRC3